MEKARFVSRLICALSAQLIVALLGVGCVAVVPYNANESYAETVSWQEVERAFGEVITRAVDPRILSAELDKNYYRYEAEQVIHGPYGIPMGSTPRPQQIHFANVSRTELYENHFVYVYDVRNRLVDKILFGSGADARTFIDIVMSARGRRLGEQSEKDSAPAESTAQ